MNGQLEIGSQLLFGGVADYPAGMPEYERFIQTPKAFFDWITEVYASDADAATDLQALAAIGFDRLWEQYTAHLEAVNADAMFLHWIATIWTHQDDVPTEAPALKDFRMESLQMQYNSFQDSGGQVPRRPLSLEELWLLGQLVLRSPITCLLNSAQPEQPLGKITRHRRLSTSRIWAELRAWYENPSLDHPDPNRPAGIGPITLLVYDGKKVAHVVTVFTLWKNRLHYHDTWPGRSLLCDENNAAGVRARESDLLDGGWSIDAGEFRRIVFAFFLYNYPPEIAHQRIELTEQERQAAERESAVMAVLRRMRPPNSSPPQGSINGATVITELELAARIGPIWRVKVALNNGADINERGSSGTPLHAAAANGHMDIVRLLVDQGADVLALDPAGNTPGQVAAKERHPAIAKYLHSLEASRSALSRA